MHVKEIPLNTLDTGGLSVEEATLVKWLRSAPWEAVTGGSGLAMMKAKVPEFFGGVRLFRMQAGGPSSGSLGALELFIKKLGLQGIIAKQGLYPLSGHSNQPRYLTLKKADLDNLGVGKPVDDEE